MYICIGFGRYSNIRNDKLYQRARKGPREIKTLGFRNTNGIARRSMIHALETIVMAIKGLLKHYP